MRAVVTGKQAFDTATVLVHLQRDGCLGLLGIESSRAPSIVVDNENGVQHDSLYDTVLVFPRKMANVLKIFATNPIR